MPKRSSKPRDLNKLAANIVNEATTDSPAAPISERNPAAVELGRRGGLKGGPARAMKLTPEERSDAARKAAQARWDRHGS